MTLDLDKYLIRGAALIFVISCVWININSLQSLQDQIKANDIEIKALQEKDSRSYSLPLLPAGFHYLPKRLFA